MNEKLSEYIIKIHNKKKFIKEWSTYRYKEKSLYIYGNPGVGKTSLANYILKDWVKIYIKSDFCKNGNNFDDFIQDSLYKKSITMMFDKNIYKALIIDDINYIQNADKKLFKSIVDFSKKNINNHPIIYILNNINHKSSKIIIKKSFPIKIELDENNLCKITKDFLLKDERIKDTKIKELVIKSNKNLHNIKVNIDFYKNDFINIKKYDTYNDELSLHIKNIFKKDTIQEIYNNSYTDYNIIALNILENIPSWIKNIDKKNKIIILEKIYHLFSISEIYSNIIHESNNWNYIDNIITCNIVYPIIILNSHKIEIKDIIYNKYISKSIIYIHNTKILNKNDINFNILYYMYNMIYNYYIENELSNKNKIKENIINYIDKYKINVNVCEKFLKFFLKDLDKKKIKIFYKL